MKKNKKLIIFIAVVMLSALILMKTPIKSSAETSTETTITLSNSKITVNNEEISEDATKAVYKTTSIEENDDISADLKSTENTIINITSAGTYRISGTIENAQISINAGDSDEVKIILDNANITCKTAPAIIVYNSLDLQKSGEAGVTITLESNSKNTLTGSHIPKSATHTINGAQTSYDAKYDGVISSDVSLAIDGQGSLIIDGDKEGIETKLHLTINGGNLEINSDDDAINASEDSVSVITINDGIIYANIKSDAEEGDGIDSNGYIYINGGQVYSFASATSQDSGLDSDLGIYINGGTVIGTGNMTDEVSSDSTQKFIFLQFTNQVLEGELVCITDENDNPIMAYKTDKNYVTFLYSSSDLNIDSYKVYIGGSITGTETNGLYTEITSYTKGTEANYSEANKSAGIGMKNDNKFNQNTVQNSNNTNNTNNSSNAYIGIIMIICGVVMTAIIIIAIIKKENK